MKSTWGLCTAIMIFGRLCDWLAVAEPLPSQAVEQERAPQFARELALEFWRQKYGEEYGETRPPWLRPDVKHAGRANP